MQKQKSESGEEKYEISIYGIGEPDELTVMQCTNRLKAAFPRMSDDFFDLLAERIIANKFTSERLKDAVNHVIDNFQYKELNVSDVIGFDRKTRMYTYSDVVTMVTRGVAQMGDFEIRKINGQFLRIKKSDLI